MDRRGLRPMRYQLDASQIKGAHANAFPMLEGEGFFEQGIAEWHAKRAGRGAAAETCQPVSLHANELVATFAPNRETSGSNYACTPGKFGTHSPDVLQKIGRDVREASDIQIRSNSKNGKAKCRAAEGQLHDQRRSREDGALCAQDLAKTTSQRARRTDPDQRVSTGLGAYAFWLFVTKSLRKSPSDGALHQKLKACQRTSGAAHGTQAKRDVHAGAKLVLGTHSPDDEIHAVKTVGATQRWAMKHVPGFKEASQVVCPPDNLNQQSSKPPLSLASVATMLAEFKQHQEPRSAPGSHKGQGPCNHAHAVSLRRRRIKGKQAPPQWVVHEEKTREDVANGDAKVASASAASRVHRRERPIRHTKIGQLPHAAGDDHGAGLACAKPVKRRKRAASRSPARHGKRSKLTNISKKEEELHRRSDASCDKSNWGTKRSADSCEKHVTVKTDAPGNCAQRVKAEETCGICQQAHANAPRSCSVCTLKIMQKLGMDLKIGDHVWCSGFGPAWPSKIEAVSFCSLEDKKPFLVRFYGDGRCAWVGKRQLRGLSERRPHDLKALQRRWRSSMAKAMEEVQAAVHAEVEASFPNTQSLVSSEIGNTADVADGMNEASSPSWFDVS